MNPKTFWVLTFVMVILATGAWLFASRSRGQNRFSEDIIYHSKEYIQKLGSKELNQLSLEQRLLLLHSYSNVKDYGNVLKVRKSMGAQFDGLPESRRKPFLAMVEEAKRHVGNSK